MNLEAEVDRAYRWELLNVRRFPRDPVSSSWLWRARQQQLESATHGASPLQRCRSVERDPIVRLPHKRINIPMLSFITSILFIDDSTINLLAHPSSDSALFPGHSYPAENEDIPFRAVKAVKGLEEHRTLKEGLAIACDPDNLPSNPFTLSGLGLGGLCRLVNGVWTSSESPRREIWTSPK